MIKFTNRTYIHKDKVYEFRLWVDKETLKAFISYLKLIGYDVLDFAHAYRIKEFGAHSFLQSHWLEEGLYFITSDDILYKELQNFKDIYEDTE